MLPLSPHKCASMQLFILLKRALLELRELCSVCHLSGRQPAEFSGEEEPTAAERWGKGSSVWPLVD